MYEARTYWEERGKTYRQEKEKRPDEDWRELKIFLDRQITRLKPSSIIEFGCGYGKVLKNFSNDIGLAGIDISETQLSQAREFLKGEVELICADLVTWQPTRRWDLGITRRFLIHLNPNQLVVVLQKIVSVCKNLLIIESFVPSDKSDYYWAHNYKKIFKAMNIGFETLSEERIERRYLCR